MHYTTPISDEPKSATVTAFTSVHTAIAKKYETELAKYALTSGLDAVHLPFIAANARHLYDSIQSMTISIMQIGTKNTNSMGSDGAENTPIMTLTCIPSVYDLYMQGAIEKNDSGRFIKSDNVNKQYTDVDSNSTKKNDTTPELPRKYPNIGDLLRKM